MTNLSRWKELLASEGVFHSDGSSTETPIFFEAYRNVVESWEPVSISVKGEELDRDELGNLVVGNSPSFAYIRRGRSNQYTRKVHFTYCQSIIDKPSDVYFCTNRNDGLFEVDCESGRGSVAETKELELEPCEWCIGKYYGLTRRVEDKAARLEIKKDFDWEQISTEVGLTLNRFAWRSKLYKFSDKSWEEISRETREQSDWACEKCGIYVGEENGALLHAHHKHGDRNFNHATNLVSLCIRCHAEEPGHESMKKMSQYKQFCHGIDVGKFKKRDSE